MIIIAVLGETQLHVVRATEKEKKIHSVLNKGKKRLRGEASDYGLAKPQNTQPLWESFEFELLPREYIGVNKIRSKFLVLKRFEIKMTTLCFFFCFVDSLPFASRAISKSFF